MDPTTKCVPVKPLVEIRDLLVVRGKQTVLQLDYLMIQEGEILAIVGPNGSGKTTLLLTLARLIKPEKGEIQFNGSKHVHETDTDYRRRLAFVMQEPLLFDTSVFDNVASGLRFRGKGKDEILSKVPIWLDRLGVGHLSKRRAGELSGGEAQRVSLARAMVLDPILLLLDEPFSSLDPPTRNALIEDLGPLLHETSTTTVFVTHDLSETQNFAERMAVILDNRLRQTGKPNDVFASPIDEEVARFLNQQTPPRY